MHRMDQTYTDTLRDHLLSFRRHPVGSEHGLLHLGVGRLRFLLHSVVFIIHTLKHAFTTTLTETTQRYSSFSLSQSCFSSIIASLSTAAAMSLSRVFCEKERICVTMSSATNLKREISSGDTRKEGQGGYDREHSSVSSGITSVNSRSSRSR